MASVIASASARSSEMCGRSVSRIMRFVRLPADTCRRFSSIEIQRPPSFFAWVFVSLILFVSCRSPEPAAVETLPDTTETERHTAVTVTDPVPVQREQRAFWLTTVSNADWPSEPGLTVGEQKEELRRLLDQAASLNMNAVIFQIRPAADAMYDSPYEPWAGYLTGQMGRAPEPWYDPLEFAIAEAHKRGLELHAWFNPYRARHPRDPSPEFSDDHISQTRPEWVHEFGEYLWIDPGIPEASEYSKRVIMDVVERYDVDGVHLDDYFYPYPSYEPGIDFPDDESWHRAQKAGVTMSRDDWRRDNVNRFIRDLHETLRQEAQHVKFGVSPIGVWRPGNPDGAIFGFDAYEQIYGDARLWLREGWVDNFTPQLYHPIDNPGRSFPQMLHWWQEQNLHGRHVWSGHFTSLVYREADWPVREISGQVYTARAHPGVSGSVHFRMDELMNDPSRELVDHLARDVYRGPALIPSYPWLGDTPPAAPEVELHTLADRLELTLRAGNDHDEVRWWVIRSEMDEFWEIEVAPGSQNRITYHGSEATVWPERLVVSAVDRLGNESEAIVLSPELDERGRPIIEATAADSESQGGSAEHRSARQSGFGAQGDTGSQGNPVSPGTSALQAGNASDTAVIEKPDIIARADWADQEPGGREANAVRRNLAEGDRLAFRDLTVVVEKMIPGKKKAEDNEYGDGSRGAGDGNGCSTGSNEDLDNNGNGNSTSDNNNNGYEAAPDSVRLSLYRYGVNEKRTVPEGYAFNWYGYHIGAVAVNTDPDVLAGGLTELEVATTASISRPPAARAAFRETGEAGDRFRVPHNVRYITLHHTGSPEPLTGEDDPVERLNNLVEWAAESRNFWDVLYHYLIDLEGNIYEGRDHRYAGDDNTPYDTRGHLMISVLGNYSQQRPNGQQLEAIIRLMAWASQEFDVPVEQIHGHYHWTDTGCPGDHLRPLLEDGTLQRQVRERFRSSD